MAAQRTSFDKLQRDRAKKAKAAAKRDRRQNGLPEGGPEPGGDQESEGPVVNLYPPGLSSAQVLERIEDIHQRFEAGTMSYEDFEEHKAELLGRLTVE